MPVLLHWWHNHRHWSLSSDMGHWKIYICAPKECPNWVTPVAFTDESHRHHYRQQCYSFNLVYGDTKRGYVKILRLCAWHNFRRPFHSTAAADIFAAGEAIDKIFRLQYTFSNLLELKVYLPALVDCQDLFGSLLVKNHTNYKSMHGDVNYIWYYYDTAVYFFAWVQGWCKPEDIGKRTTDRSSKLLFSRMKLGS